MKYTTIALAATACMLSACGGGGDSSTSKTSDPSSGSASSTLSGVVATGLPLVGAKVNVTCKAGSASATTSASGSYSVDASGLTLPCVLAAVSADGKVELHSVVPGSGAAGTAVTSNISPLTDLLLAQYSGTTAAQFIASFSASTVINSSDIKAAQTALVSVLKGSGVDTSTIDDLIGGKLDAGSHQGYDAVLDTLQSVIAAASTTLSEVGGAIASNAANPTTASGAITTVLAPASTACSTLKSGAHRIIDLASGTMTPVTIDAVNLTASMNGSSYKLSKNAACDFTLDDSAGTRVLVARSGMASWTSGSASSGKAAVSIPAQTMDPAAVNGTYNYALLSGPYQNEFGTHTYAKGVTTAATNCETGVSSCTVDTNSPYGHLVAREDGGADWVDDGSDNSAGFLAYGFTNAQGRSIWLVSVKDSGGGVGVFASQANATIPAIDSVSTYNQFTIDKSTGLSAVTQESWKAASVSDKTLTRLFSSDSHTDELTFNTPYQGLRHRLINACKTSIGASMSCMASLQMPLSGITFSWSADASRQRTTVSVTTPEDN